MNTRATKGRSKAASFVLALLPAACGLLSTPASADWYDANFPLRRPLDLIAEARNIDGYDTAVAEFYAPGLIRPDAGDLRIAADDGTPVAMRIIQAGPGDRVRVAFNPAKGQVRHYAYWGNKAAKLPEIKPFVQNAGLLVETKRLPGGDVNNFKQQSQAWERGGEVIGAAMIDRLFLGYHPSMIEGDSISRITGNLYSPADGEYQIAASIDDRGSVRIDDTHVLNVPGFPEDIRFNTKLNLSRGAHTIEVFHVNRGGEWRISVGWRRPDSPRLEPIAADSFGRLMRSKPGPLEQHHKELVADVQMTHLGECILDNRSSYRLRLEAPVPPTAKNVRVTWDFGDGQTASGAQAEHVFLTPGVYDVQVSIKSVQADDKRTIRLQVGRDPFRIVDPQLDESIVQAPLVTTYDPRRLSPAQLAQATRICARAKQIEPMLAMLKALCAVTRHPDQQWAVDAIEDALTAADEKRITTELAAAMSSLTPQSNLHPKAAVLHAGVLLWRTTDFKQAATMLEPFMTRDSQTLKRLRMTALLLAEQPEAARKILDQLQDDADGPKRVALSGAIARSIEFFIEQSEFDAANEQWDEWQRRFPSTLFDGYAAVLKVRMLAPHYPRQAAVVGEAFALALPTSPYAPQLLDFAAKALAPLDAAKAAALRMLLKQKYPEDPLAQD